MSDWTVHRRGTDSSGRGIFASDFMWEWWLGCCEELGFTPTITQGAWMTLTGGGAGDSAGYHDGGGCFDLRLYDRTPDQRERMIRVFRSRGAAYWERYESQGFELHAHLLLGSDHDIDDGAAYQWRQYIAGKNGLASNGPDYHWRPDPLVLTPPQEDEMADYAKQLDAIQADVKATRKAVADMEAANKARAKAEAAHRRKIAANLRAVVRDHTGPIREGVEALADELESDAA